MKKGFSLAEILITLGVIGVIASVTMPMINTNLWKSQRAALLKNANERLNNAFTLAIQDLGYTPKCVFGNSTDDCEAFGNAMLANLRVIRECQTSEANDTSCHPKYERRYNIAESKYYYITSGMAVLNNPNHEEVFSPSHFFIDTNGVKGPNKWGQDVFEYRTAYARNGKNIVLKPGNDHTLLQSHNGIPGMTAMEILRNIEQQ